MLSRLLVILLVPILLLTSSGVDSQPALAILNEDSRPSGPASFGLNSHLATRYPDPSTMATPAAHVAELGVPWVREDLHWHRVEPRPDVWDWTFTDAALRELLSRDIEVLGVLGPSVGWATPFPGDTPNDVSFYAPDPDLFIEYVRAVVNRYHLYIHYWEIWNEPDNPYFWKPQPDPHAYADLLMRTSAAIKAIDPQAQVLIGGFNPFDTTFVQDVISAGAWDSFDIIAIHPYVDPYGPEEGNITNSVRGVRALAHRFGSKPIWITELGWASGPGDRDPVGVTDEQAQANFLVRSLLLLWNAGVERSFWYTLKDDPGNPYGLFRFGTGRADFSQPKPVFTAFQTLNRAVVGATFLEHRDLFALQMLVDFEQAAGWRRTSQPNGSLRANAELVNSGQSSAQLIYNFSTAQNDYVVFERDKPLLLDGEPHALGVWVYGDGGAIALKVWLRDAEGELLQFVLGEVGPPGWHFLAAPIGGAVEPGNRIEGRGNGRLDFPARFAALVVDDVNDRFKGRGTIYVDDLTAINGQEAYNLRLQRGEEALDILWSPPGVQVALDTRGASGMLMDRDGATSQLSAKDGFMTVDLGPEPIYLWHQR
ncbi:MAG: glycosyl hydrolase [Chloroflexales bacterium]|nr:glycosyl hydrolase [Chloroflexales bacterium]